MSFNISKSYLWEPKGLEHFVIFRNPAEIWSLNPSYLCLEISTYIFALLNLRHALRLGGRYPWLWLATIIHGWTVEILSYTLNDIDNFWHSQSSVVFFKGRFPLHIVLFYPFFLYSTNVIMAGKLRLPKWAEPFAVGLGAVLIDLPFDIMGIKLHWWTWHDTDPNIYDRHYWVPWTSYYFHAAFASSFAFLFHRLHDCVSSKPKMQADGFSKELLVTCLTGMLAMPLGCLQFIPIYHYFHDVCGIHTEVPVCVFLTIYIFIFFRADREPQTDARPHKGRRGWVDEQVVILVLHYLFYIILVFKSQPETIVNYGLHETLGPCNETMDVLTVTGKVLKKRRYLCPELMDEGYQSFHCLPGGQPPAAHVNRYTTCGTPYENRTEYELVVSAASAFGTFVWLTLLSRSGQQLSGRAKVGKKIQ